MVRNRARRALEEFGPSAEPALRRAREKSTSLEVQRRLDELLAAVEAQKKSPGGDLLRGMRAVEVREQAGTPEARKALEALAAGAPASALTQAATVAVGHLRRAEKR